MNQNSKLKKRDLITEQLTICERILRNIWTSFLGIYIAFGITKIKNDAFDADTPLTASKKTLVSSKSSSVEKLNAGVRISSSLVTLLKINFLTVIESFLQIGLLDHRKSVCLN